jgi:hypothetical protein
MNIFNSKLIVFLLVEILSIPILFKLITINFFFITDEESLFYRIIQTIAHDSIIYFFIIIFIYLSYLRFINYLLSILFRLISLFIFLLYVVDIFVLNSFSTHLILDDVLKYITYAPKYMEQLYSFNILTLFFFLLSIFLISIFLFKKYKIESKKNNMIYSFILMILFIFYSFTDNGRYIHSWLYKNFIEYNYEIMEQSKEYTDSFKTNLSNHKKEICYESKKNNKNIIILMVESLSSYQSKYFSGIKDWTPNIDNIAKENLSFKNFHANGFVTEDAEISILTGEYPIYSTNTFSDGGGVSFSGFFNLKYSLPYLLKLRNYQTEFITSSDLEFSHTGLWAKSIGFDYVEGSEHEFYSDKKRFHFGAAGDEFLYERVLDRISKQNSEYFLFIKTVSSHAPFINPQSLSKKEEDTIKYIDKYIGDFYRKLEKENFFDNGILIIVGDHHPVIPIKKEQIDKYGIYKAPIFVPMILVDKDKKTEINNKNFQQVDIYNSIKNYVSNKSCTSLWQGDFLSENKTEAQYMIHRRGDQRGIVTVLEDNKVLNIKLNGDNTRVIDGENNQELIDKINYIRIQREKKEFNFANQ